jgi:hypothetical protein
MRLTAIFTGPGSVGIAWPPVGCGVPRGELHARQCADRFDTIGPLKSAAGIRTVPLLPVAADAREWRLACPLPRADPGPHNSLTIFGTFNQHFDVLKQGERKLPPHIKQQDRSASTIPAVWRFA